MVRGLDEGLRGSLDGPPAMGIRSSVGTGSPATSGCPFRRARTGTVARTCRVIPRHTVVHTLRMAFSKNTLLDTTAELSNLINKSNCRRLSAAKRLVVQRDESA